MPAPKKRLVTAEDLYSLQQLSNVSISPDGGHVVYRIQRVDRKTEKKYGNLWVVPSGGGEPRQFTHGNQSDYSPSWSPDGNTIAFLSSRAGNDNPQIHLIPFDGGEARKLTSIDGEIDLVGWSPDGRKLLCTIRKTDTEELEREKDEQKKKLGVVVRHYTRLFYKMDGYGYLPHERTHIWVVDARTGKGKQLTEGAVHDENFPVYSPDGRSIAYISNRTEDPDANVEHDDIFVMPADGGKPRKLNNTPLGAKFFLAFSPDGKWLAYFGAEGEHLDYQNTSLWVVPVDGSEPARNLTKKYDLHTQADIITDFGSAETVAPVWSNDGKAIYFQAAVHGSTVLRRIDIAGKNMT
jgi:Tol biopolymer transport system component